LTNIREYIDTQALARASEKAALTFRPVSSRQTESADLGEYMIANVLAESRSVTISLSAVSEAPHERRLGVETW